MSMIKKTYTFTDYAGNERTEDYYFYLNDAEVIKMELGVDGGFTEKIKRIIAARDIPEIIKVFDEMIDASYGVKSPDGREFVKSPEITAKFKQCEGYSKLFKDFVSKEGFAAEFFNQLIPHDIVDDVVSGDNNEKENIVTFNS